MRPLVRLSVTHLAPGGDGVGHVAQGVSGRRAVFVRGAAPGDELEVEVDLSTRPARGRIARVLVPSPDRREPPCPHAARCGGCALMHLTPDAQRRARVALLDDTVLRVLEGALPVEIVHHEAPFDVGYRTRARFAVEARGRVTAGFRRAAERAVVDLSSCLVLAPELQPTLGLLRAALAGSKGRGEAGVALGARGAPVLELSWAGELAPLFFASIERFIASGDLVGACVALDEARTPMRFGDPTIWTPGSDGHLLETPGFAQTNPTVTAAIAAHLAERCATAGREVVELFSGAGTFTVALARGAARYLAVESDGATVEAARRNLARRGIEGVRLVAGDAASVALPRSTSLVVLDPPRAGAAQLVAPIAATKATDVHYVSCDPVTLARDVKKLQDAGFSLRALHTFDMFPQTSHVETVVHLVRGRGR